MGCAAILVPAAVAYLHLNISSLRSVAQWCDLAVAFISPLCVHGNSRVCVRHYSESLNIVSLSLSPLVSPLPIHSVPWQPSIDCSVGSHAQRGVSRHMFGVVCPSAPPGPHLPPHHQMHSTTGSFSLGFMFQVDACLMKLPNKQFNSHTSMSPLREASRRNRNFPGLGLSSATSCDSSTRSSTKAFRCIG